MVQSTRQEFLKTIAAKRPVTKKIILIGPNHFSQNQFQILSSDRNWQLSTGVFNYEKLLDLPINNSVLLNDHAIYNPLADLKTYFPNARVYPILIGQKADPKRLDPIISQLIQICRLDCLLIASVDFSHYLPATLAEVHDAFTLNNLYNSNSSKILQSEVDSPQSLYVLINFSKSKKFNLFAHTNSGFMSKNPDVETTTHVFGYYSPGLLHKTTVLTSTILPYPIDRQSNQNTLGDRFFYGVDQTKIDSSIDFVTSTIQNSSKTIKVILPIKNNLFIRGPEKQQLIKTYFDSIPNDKSLTKDYFWGKLTYERR